MTLVSFDLCVFENVCVCVHMFMCMHVHACVCMHIHVLVCVMVSTLIFCIYALDASRHVISFIPDVCTIVVLLCVQFSAGEWL